MTIRTVIVDDEPLVRRGLRRSLAGHNDVVVVAECATGLEALAVLRTERPDLVLLDVQMPDLDGFSVLAQLAPEERPVVVFVTAYDQYALQAFEVHAVDYLLKPFDDERLARALARARESVGRGPVGELQQRLAELLSTVQQKQRYLERVLVKKGERLVVVEVDAVNWMQAAGNYVRIHTDHERHVLRATLKALEEQLDPRRFVRIHRSAIVNLSRVGELRPLPSGDYALHLRDGTKLTLSRGYREEVQGRLGGRR